MKGTNGLTVAVRLASIEVTTASTRPRIVSIAPSALPAASCVRAILVSLVIVLASSAPILRLGICLR